MATEPFGVESEVMRLSHVPTMVGTYKMIIPNPLGA
jgi:hypothetical protein